MVPMFPGGDKRDRTADLLNAIQALSQLSTPPTETVAITGFLASALLIFSSVARLILTKLWYHERAEKSTFSALFLRPHRPMSLTRR